MSFFENHIGEFAALFTACFWTITSLSFEKASNRIGSVAVNILRLVIGLIFLSLFTLARRGMILPVDAAPKTGSGLYCQGWLDLFLAISSFLNHI